MQFKHQYKKESNRAKDEWCTPPKYYDPLNEVFRFTLDAAANSNNAKCERYLDAEMDGLLCSWQHERVFVNPPYTEKQYGDWIKKACSEWVQGRSSIVLLVPASLETDAFIPVWEYASYLILPYKRISFLSPDGTRIGGAPFASAIPIFGFSGVLDGSIGKVITSKVGHVMRLNSGAYRSKYR